MASLSAERLKGLHRLEPALFLLLLAAHVLVLFRFEWYPTLDGPAHLYNAHLIKQMLLGNEFLPQFLVFSSFPEPNWSGHAIMALLGLALPPDLVEKGLVLLIFGGTALSFRALIRSITGAPTFGTLLIFPFLCTYTFRMGFFNFSISVAVFLLVLAHWQQIRRTASAVGIVLLSLLLIVLYFSNALTTLICIATLGAWCVLELWIDRGHRREGLRSLLYLVLASAPALVLILLFVFRGAAEGTIGHLPAEKLWTMVRDGFPFTLQNGISMLLAARTIAVCLVLWVAIMIMARKPWRFQLHDLWLGIALLSLVGYLILPDKAATGWFISVRFLLFTYLFMAIWIAVQPRWPVFGSLLIVPFLIADLWLVRVDHAYTGSLNADVIEMRSALQHVNDDAIILPILYTDNWLLSNFSNYLGTERGILVIDNYEAMSPHFPLRWRPQHRAPNTERSFFNSNRPCIDIDALGDTIALRFDHVLRWEFHPDIQDSCARDLSDQLDLHFELVHRSPHGKLELFRR